MLRRLCFIHSRERLCSAPLLFLSAFLDGLKCLQETSLKPEQYYQGQTYVRRHIMQTHTQMLTHYANTQTHTLSLARAHFICTHKHSHVNSHECCILQLILKHYILYQTTQLTTQYHSDMKQRR